MRQLGIIQVLLSGVCFGVLGVFGKWAFASGLKPGEFLGLRFSLGALFLGLWLLLTDRTAFRLKPKTLLHCVLLGTFGYALFSSCFFLALTGLSVSLTSLLLYTYPVMVSLGAWMLFQEKLGLYQRIALPLVCAGLAMLVWGDLKVYSKISFLFGILSAIFYSVYILSSSRVLKSVNPLASTFYINLSAGLLLSALHVRDHTIATLPVAYPYVLGTAFIGTMLAMSLFLAGLQKLKSAEVSVLSTAEPVMGVLLAVIFLGERLSLVQWSGAALILAGMIITGWRKS
jgi:DME family drug/metabolite transporter